MYVNENRLWDTLCEMAQLGALDEGGCCRTALSESDGQGRDLFAGWCREAGCSITCDAAGNWFARRSGTDADAAAVATGSHLDTQPHGGRFDGVFGVLAGLEVVRTLNDHRINTRRPIDVVVWTNEEGVRFSPPLAGSSVFCGNLALSALHATVTTDGTTVREDLEQIGYLGKETPGTRRLDCFIEAHIEQGPILEHEARTIGVVTGIQGAHVFRVEVHGEDGHAGTVPLDQRRDSVVGMADMITYLRALAAGTDPLTKLTVGCIQIRPNSISTIPGEAVFTIDIRHPDSACLAQMVETLLSKLPAIASKHELDTKITHLLAKEPVIFSGEIVDLIQSSADELGYSNRRMLSCAGHDAMNLAVITPTAMIFVPCKGGISHNQREYASPADLAAGANVLLRTVLARASTVAEPQTPDM